MNDSIPDGPTDPRLSMPDDNTTIVSPNYGAPMHAPTPYSRPPIVPGPPGPVGSPIVPVTEQLDPEPASGRIYTSERPASPPSTGSRTGADRGKTTIADDVVERVIEKIINLTVDEVDGVDGLHTGPDTERAVAVTLDGDDATIDVAIRVAFGHAVHEVVERVRASIIDQAERLLGLTVVEVNVLVGDVTFDGPE